MLCASKTRSKVLVPGQWERTTKGRTTALHYVPGAVEGKYAKILILELLSPLLFLGRADESLAVR